MSNVKQSNAVNLEQRLADEFAVVIRSWLTSEELAAVDEKNSALSSGCASHDYCDANCAMYEAFERVVGREPSSDDEDVNSNADCALWNAAWSLRKAQGFSSK